MAATASDHTTAVGLLVAGHGTTCTLTAVGELDVATAPALRRAVATALTGAREIVVVDLGETTFIDSTGVHAVLDADARCRDAGVRLVVLATEGVRRVFELCGVADRLPLVRPNRAAPQDGAACC